MVFIKQNWFIISFVFVRRTTKWLCCNMELYRYRPGIFTNLDLCNPNGWYSYQCYCNWLYSPRMKFLGGNFLVYHILMFFHHFSSHSAKIFCFARVSATTNNNKAISADGKTRFNQVLVKQSIIWLILPSFHSFKVSQKSRYSNELSYFNIVKNMKYVLCHETQCFH